MRTSINSFLKALAVYCEEKQDGKRKSDIVDFIPRLKGAKGLLTCYLAETAFRVMKGLNKLFDARDNTEKKLFSEGGTFTGTEEEWGKYAILMSSLETRIKMLIKIYKGWETVNSSEFYSAKKLLGDDRLYGFRESLNLPPEHFPTKDCSVDEKNAQLSSQDFFGALLAFIDGKQNKISEHTISNFFPKVENAKRIVGSYLIGLVFKEMTHLVKLLDMLHAIEDKLLRADTVGNSKKQDWKKSQILISKSVQTTFGIIMEIAARMEGKGLLLENLKLLDDLKKPKSKFGSFPPERREKLRQFMTDMIQKYGKELLSSGKADRGMKDGGERR